MGIDEDAEIQEVSVTVLPHTGPNREGAPDVPDSPNGDGRKPSRWATGRTGAALASAKKMFSFIGPGLMVAVAYMDPGNYSTDVTAGAQKRFSLLFVILLSTVIALYLQSLAVKLGSVTGKDLARNCREHLPKWVGYILYVFAEAAIIATDIAEVIGTAIALNILLHIPLMAGVVLTIVDVMVVLLLYRPGKSMRTVRLLEYGVGLLLLAVVICFCVLLARIPHAPAGEVFHGFLPTRSVITDGGIYMAAGILGATVMPHSLYLGSAMAIPRIRQYDRDHGMEKNTAGTAAEQEVELDNYQPSINAIGWAYRYSVIELLVALCTVAIFVNSAILIVAGSVMYGTDDAASADIYSIYNTIKQFLSKGAAVTFMVALLCSGQSAGVICTIAGQIVSEGHVRWRVRPWIRRVITRGIAIIPCVVVVGAVGKDGLSKTLNWSQVVLTITLPFLASPLVYLTSLPKVMTVYKVGYDVEVGAEDGPGKSYANSWPTAILGAALCVFIFIVNIFLLVQVGINGSP